LEAIILRALEKDPLKRFATPNDFQQALLLISNPQSGRAINPSSNPGLSGETSTMAQDGPTIAASRTQLPDVPSSMVTLSAQTQGSVLQNTPPANQQLRANSLHSEQVITPGRPGINEPMRTVQQSWTPLQPIPQALPQPERRKKGCTPVMVLLLLLLLLAGMVSALFLTPIGKGLLSRNITATTGPGTQTANTQTINTPTGNETTPGTGATPPIVNNNNMPKTVTTCPGSGTARSAVIAPLSLGNHPTIVYIVNEGPANAPTAGTVKIYDTVTTKKTEISKINAATIDAAQVSRNRQWVLFTVSVAGRSQLRQVRLDGKGLQTLYCATNGTHITAAQWSVDQKFVIFDELPEAGPPTIYLLNLQDGSIQVEVNSSIPGGISLLPRTWLDNTHVVMTGFVPQSDAPLANVYLLDISKGANQSTGDIQQIFDSSNSGQCWDFDSNNGGDALYIAQCTPNQPHGSGKITRQAVNGHSLTAILDSSTLAINSVRVVDPNDTHLLATASDIGLGASNGDPENDGLYLVKTSDGSFQRLLGAKSGEVCTLNTFSQYFWSNISRDSSMYVVQTTNASAHRYSLAYGKISGGPLTTFADITDTALAIAGWTTT
ncbi:MAG TPA: hypothetical protein VFN35_22090, partial [Ktedonobacteraceae bacterium]|nr:hypothetical protein [Ktedonobacteraceae bacterium]